MTQQGEPKKPKHPRPAPVRHGSNPVRVQSSSLASAQATAQATAQGPSKKRRPRPRPKRRSANQVNDKPVKQENILHLIRNRVSQRKRDKLENKITMNTFKSRKARARAISLNEYSGRPMVRSDPNVSLDSPNHTSRSKQNQDNLHTVYEQFRGRYQSGRQNETQKRSK